MRCQILKAQDKGYVVQAGALRIIKMQMRIEKVCWRAAHLQAKCKSTDDSICWCSGDLCRARRSLEAARARVREELMLLRGVGS